jgi:hypothetical protein
MAQRCAIVERGPTGEAVPARPLPIRAYAAPMARTPDEAGGDITVWSCTPREARQNDQY